MRSRIIQEQPYWFVSPSVFGREAATDPSLFSPAGLTRKTVRRASAVSGSPLCYCRLYASTSATPTAPAFPRTTAV
jgi:hypothetical protein